MRYLYICPRGFSNEWRVYAVPDDCVEEAQDHVDRYSRNPDFYSAWLSRAEAHKKVGRNLSTGCMPWEAMQGVMGYGIYALPD